LFTTSQSEAVDFGGVVQSFEYGQDIGFVNVDFV
jgi:hypothetical protein